MCLKIKNRNHLKLIFLFFFIAANAYCGSFLTKCKSRDGFEATITVNYSKVAGSKVSLDNIEVMYEESESNASKVKIDATEVFDTPELLKASVHKEKGAAFSHIVYENRSELKSTTYMIPSRAIIFSAARKTLEVVDLIDSADYFFSNCNLEK
jgi:hypothetical protein